MTNQDLQHIAPVTPQEDELLDIMEPGNVPSEEQLAWLEGDAVAQEACQDLMDVTTVIRKDSPSPALPQESPTPALPQGEGGKRNPFRPWRIVAMVSAVAAVAMVALIMVLRPRGAAPFAGSAGETAQGKAPAVTFVAEQRGTAVRRYAQDPTQAAVALITAQTKDYDFQRVSGQGVDTLRICFKVPRGNDAALTLPDGTKVYLHPGSSIIFPSQFKNTQRVVELNGEAYFAVAHEARRTFVVKAGGVETTVLGTEFNVNSRAYGGTQVTLVRGKVSVAINNNRYTQKSQSMVIAPGEQAYVDDGMLCSRTVSTAPFEAWRDGYLLFDNMPIRSIVQQIADLYGLQVRIDDAHNLDERMRFVCDRNSSLDTMLQMLNGMKKVKVHRTDHELIVE